MGRLRASNHPLGRFQSIHATSAFRASPHGLVHSPSTRPIENLESCKIGIRSSSDRVVNYISCFAPCLSQEGNISEIPTNSGVWQRSRSLLLFHLSLPQTMLCDAWLTTVPVPVQRLDIMRSSNLRGNRFAAAYTVYPGSGRSSALPWIGF